MNTWTRMPAFLLAGLLVLFSFTACSPDIDEFTVLARTIPSNLDPQLAFTAEEKTAVTNLFEGLYRRGEDGTPQLAAAESVEISDNGLVWRFTLRSGQYWDTYKHDGETVETPVTADDFLFAFERMFTRATNSPWAADFSHIKNASLVLNGATPRILGVEKEDDYTLVITLDTPDEHLPEKLCSAGAMPCNRAFFEHTQGAYGLSASALLANGPFRVRYWVAGENLTLRREEDKQGLVDLVRFSVQDGDEALTAAERFLGGEGSGALVAESEADGYDALGHYATTTWALAFNCRIDFLSNRDARAALAAVALDVFDTDGTEGLFPATGLIPPGVGGEESWRAYAGNVLEPESSPTTVLRRALDAMAGSGEDGTTTAATTPVLTVLVPDSGPYAALFDEINASWQRRLYCYFGVERLPLEELLDRVAAGDYEIAFLPLYAASDRPAAMLENFRTGAAGSFTGWGDESFDSTLAMALTAEGTTYGSTLLLEAERLLLAGWPVVPLAFEESVYVLRTSFEGLWADPFGPVLEFSAKTP